jgi:putative tricarboxylic transport membrane protein
MLSELLIGTSALVASIIFFAISFTFPAVTADPGGLALFPRMAAILTGTSSIFFLVRLAAEHRSFDPVIQTLNRFLVLFLGAGMESNDLRRSIFVFALSAMYPIAILKIGFLLASFAFSFILVVTYRGAILAALILSLCLAVGLNLFFVSLMGLTVPSGDWTGPLLDSLFY